jgi:DnaK suppressor protein
MSSLDLDEARHRLQAERDRLRQLQGSLAGETTVAATEELSSVDQHPADIGTETFEQSKDVSILAQVDVQLADVARALDRLDHGDYGRCEACGAPIGDERLEARPAARFCVRDQAEAERGVGTAPPGAA